MSSEFFLADPADTEALAEALARSMPERAVIHLHGQLGAGKSTLARAMLRALGVAGPIKSPTYSLVERYRLDQGEAAHLDLYRIAEAAELEFLGLDDLAATTRLWLVEWPEKGRSALSEADLHVHLAVDGDGRRAVLQPNGQLARDWLDRLNKIAAPTRSS